LNSGKWIRCIYLKECFIDDGDIDVTKALRILNKNGFDSFIIDDHIPHIVGDTSWGHRARAHAMGYLQGVVASLSIMSS
jgi:mannonate dehydratase